MPVILDLADEICASSKNELKEIYIISDFQKSNFNAAQSERMQLENSKTLNAKTYLLNIGSREVNNLSLDSFKVKTDLPEKDKEIKIHINLNNFSQFNVSNKTVNLIIENEFVSSKVTDAGSFSRNELEFKFKAKKAGKIQGCFELVQNIFSEDELIQDNKYYFNISIPEKFNVLLIEENLSQVSFLETAIKSANDLLSDSVKRKSEMFVISRDKTIDENIFKNDVVFISDKKSFTDNEFYKGDFNIEKHRINSFFKISETNYSTTKNEELAYKFKSFLLALMVKRYLKDFVLIKKEGTVINEV